MEVLLAAQSISASKIRATFLILAHIRKEQGNEINLNKRQLRILCGLTKSQLIIHLDVLRDNGLIEYDNDRGDSIKLTYHEAYRKAAFSFNEKEQAVLDDMGLLPTYQYSRTKLAQSAKAARKRRMGDKAYTNAKKQSSRHKVSKKTELAVTAAMNLYDEVMREYLDRMRPVNVKGNSNGFSTVIPKGRRARESRHFISFQTLIEEARLHDVEPKDWIQAQFKMLDEIPYPNSMIGKCAFQRVQEAQELGMI